MASCSPLPPRPPPDETQKLPSYHLTNGRGRSPPTRGFYLHVNSSSMRPLFRRVSYNCGLFSIWHSPIFTPISAGSSSILNHLRITSSFSYTALPCPTIKKAAPPSFKGRPDLVEIQCRDQE
ncbi:hypothetical protein Acr_17g0008720 [Actinidia rufa]|uniref:Uncharacterized protein n=1 Tax=Actinidia rufa TaxID=165716 RepID=A0A7J0G3E6_9ERIC|nr:hypothetical protein Acr_17g0008720 [Actinidia rufa]